MYKNIRYLSAVHFGFDAERLHLRVDFLAPARDMVVAVHVVYPRPHRVRIPLRKPVMTLDREEGSRFVTVRDLSTVACGRILELSIPFRDLSVVSSQRIRFYVSVLKDELEVERHPETGLLSITVPDKSYERVMWHV